MSKARGLINNILVFGAGTFLAKLVQFLLLPLYTYYLSSNAYADGELLNNAVELAYPLATLCIYDAVFRFILADKNSKLAVLTNAALVSGSLLGLSGVVCLVLSITSSDLRPLLFFMLLATYSLRQFLAFYARGSNYSIPFALSGVIDAASLAVFSYLLIVVFNMSSEGYVLALVLSHLASAVYLLLATKVHRMIMSGSEGGSRRAFDKLLCKDMLRYSVPLIGYNTFFWVSTMSSRYILAFIAGASAAGLYLAAMKLSAVVNMIQQVFYYAFQINASVEYESQGDLAYLSKVYWAFSFLLISLTSILMCIMPVLGGIVLQGEFGSASIFLSLALYSAFIDCLFCYYKSLYSAYKKTLRSMLSTFIGAISNIALCFLLIPRYAIWGALLALLVSNVAMSVIRALDAKRFAPIDQRWRSNAIPILLIGVQVLYLSLSLPHSTAVCIAICLSLILFLVFSYRRELRGVVKRINRFRR